MFLAFQHFFLIAYILLSLDLDLQNILMTGLGSFVVHRSTLTLPQLVFDIDVSVPKLDISTQVYDFTGDVLNAIPLYGNGKALFQVEGFRFQAKIFLKQSEDERSVIIDRIEDASFEIPSFKSDLDGAIGGGDIDAVVNAMIEEVIIDYINRFQGAISKVSSDTLVKFVNPYLNQLDTWKYIEILL